MDWFFTYAITGTNLIICYNNDLDLFAYIATSQYTSNKFYRVMINIGALKKSTAGYK